MKPIVLVVCLLSILQSSQPTILKVSQGIYSRVTVEITESVPRQECQRVVRNTKSLISSVSEQLHSVSGGGHFKDVLVILPTSWKDTECATGITASDINPASYSQSPDFLISGPDALTGSRPFAVKQFGQCGTSGFGVRIPFPILTRSPNLTIESETSTFLQWSRNRYGIFPTDGFDQDPLYPRFFQKGPNEEETLGCNETDFTSQMGLCSNDFYNRDVPSKQNILCQRESPLDVMLSHPDFEPDERSNFTEKIRDKTSFEVTKPHSGSFVPPQFNFRFPSTRRVILVLDISQKMEKDGKWNQVRNSLFRFLNHIPEGTELSIVTFGHKAKSNNKPTVVKKSNIHGLLGKIPFRLLSDEEGCVACGLNIATQLLTLNDAATSLNGGSIVLITASEASEASLNQVRKVIENNAIPVYNVAFKAACDDVSKLAKFGGNFVVQPKQKKLLQKLADIFVSIINQEASTSGVKKSFEKDYIWQQDEVITGNFVVEENLNKNLWMILTNPFKEDVEVFELTSPSGKQYVYPKYEFGLVYFYMLGTNEAGIWTYKAKLVPMVKSGVPLTVEVISESVGRNAIEVKTWTNVPFDGTDDLHKEVIIYASVFQGSMPIRDAKVVAHIEKPGHYQSVELELRDQGTGYPDITKGDGIYSAYFIDLSSDPGLYSLSVTASHNSGSAHLPRTSFIDISDMEHDCCGSEMGRDLLSIPTKSFEQLVSGRAFKINNGVEYYLETGTPRVKDIFPPSRVTDLKVENYVNQTLYATLSWSAPGGDYDHGKAFRYEIRCYTQPNALSDANFSHSGITVHESLLPEPSEYGRVERATVGLPWSNAIFYYGLVAIDEKGNRSPVSNLVAVYAAEITTTVSSEPFSGSDLITSDQTMAILDKLGDNLYIIGAAIASLMLIILVIIFVKIFRAKRADLIKAKNKRTQIFVNDIEPSHAPHHQDMSGLPDLAPEKSISYGGVWTTTESSRLNGASSQGSGGNHSPSSEFSNEFNLYNHQRNTNLSISEGASWAYMAAQHQQHPISVKNQAPVHDFRPPLTSTEEEDANPATAEATPTYQNWMKPPSDNGTTATSSTECSTYESDQSEKTQATVVVSGGNKVHVGHQHHLAQPYYNSESNISDAYKNNNSLNSYTPCDPTTLSLTPSFISENKRRRQESLV